MIRPLALYIGLRYTRAKRHNHFVSFIAVSSMLGIALGVAVLITVLSVMNGFDHEIKTRFFSMAPQLTITSFGQGIEKWQAMSDKVKQNPHVTGVAPFVGGQALMMNEGFNIPAVLYGVSPKLQSQVSDLKNKMVQGKFSNLKPGDFGIVVGVRLARRLALSMGDKVAVMIPKATVSIAGVHARLKQFTVVGIFKAGAGFGFDNRLAYIDLQDAQVLYLLGKNITGLRVKLDDVYNAPIVSQVLRQQLPTALSIGDWTGQFGAFFKAIKLEKTMMFLILILIIAVAAFNLVSSLVMTVTDKQSDIAILRTLGALPRTILSIFMIQGTIIGVVGLLIGLIGGVILSWNVTEVVNWIQNTFHVELLSANVYFVDYLPSKIELADVMHVMLIALGMSFVATIYPAWRASRTQPAEALRYD